LQIRHASLALLPDDIIFRHAGAAAAPLRADFFPRRFTLAVFAAIFDSALPMPPILRWPLIADTPCRRRHFAAEDAGADMPSGFLASAAATPSAFCAACR